MPVHMVSTYNHQIKAFSLVLLSWAAGGLFLHFLFFWDFFAFFLCSLFVFLLILLGYTLLKNLTVTFSKLLGDEHNFEPSQLVPRINRGGHFLLIEADKNMHNLK